MVEREYTDSRHLYMETHCPILNIVGEKVALGPLHCDLLPLDHRWTSDFATLRMQGMIPAPTTMEWIIARYESGTTDDSLVLFAIYERATMRPIGVTNFQSVDYRNRTAEFVIFIGEQTARGKGYGTETARLMLDYAFTALGLHNVMLTVYAYNPAAIRTYEKAGFRECGRRRESVWMGGRRWDTVYMECLASAFARGTYVATVHPTPRRRGRENQSTGDDAMQPNEPTALMEHWLATDPENSMRLREFYAEYGETGFRDEAEDFLTANPGTSAIAEELLQWAVTRTPRTTRYQTLEWIGTQIDWDYLTARLRARPSA